MIFVLLAATILIGLYILKRLSELDNRVDGVVSSKPSRRDFDALIARVAALESPERSHSPGESFTQKTEAGVRPAETTDTVMPVVPEPVVIPEPPPPAATHIIEPPFISEPQPVSRPDPQPVSPPAPEIGLAQRIRNHMGNEEWETLVGGSVLNKIGAVLLVIGITLFLGYSFGHVGPARRAETAIAISIALLVSGVRMEKRPHFKIFSRGLIGAGWAALYVTAYALYAIPATRIIANPFTGSVILLAVACGMILHSLRYRVQAITGVTYVAAFAALAITPATPFAVLSLIPIAASLLYLAWRFNWYGMALFGIVATYLTCLSKSNADASLAGSQTLLLAYWLLFECFDWLRMSRRAIFDGVEWIFPVNAAGFLGMSYAAWAAHSPGHLWLASGCAAALYLLSAAIRFRIRPPASFEPSDAFPGRLRTGSFEGATLISAVMAGLAIFGRVTGVWRSASVAFEAELVFLAGVAFDSVFLRGLSAGAFTISLVSLGASGEIADSSSRTLVLGHSFWNWSPGALLHAALFYINREIRCGGAIFSTIAAVLISLVLALEVQPEWAGAACALFGILLICAGLRRRLIDFRIQGYALAAGGFLWTVGFCMANASGPWMPVAVCLALAFIVTASLTFVTGEQLLLFALPREHSLAITASTAATVVLSSLLLWRVVPGDYRGIAWCLLTVAFLELGIRSLPAVLRKFFLPMATLTAIGIMTTHSADLRHLPPFATWATYLVACLACVTSAVRLSSKQFAAMPEQTLARDLICVPGVACASIVVWLLAPLSLVSLVWMFIAITLVELFRRVRMPVLAHTATVLAAVAYGRVMFTDLASTNRIWDMPVRVCSIALFIAAIYWLRNGFATAGYRRLAKAAAWSALGPFLALTLVEARPENVAAYWIAGTLALLIYGTLRREIDFHLQGYCLAGLSLYATLWFDLSPARLLVSIPVVAALYAARVVLRREEDQRAPMCFSLAATMLLAAVLYFSVSGHMLTVAWGVEGLILLIAGFGLRDRPSRLQGLALLLLCTLKLFFYDLRNLETPYRILSFIVLGLMLLGVSWTYSRFREQLRKIL